MKKRAIVHVGVHKTGTTSIQEFLVRHHEKLRTLGADFYTGQHIRNNHVELCSASLRIERDFPFNLDTGLSITPSYCEKVAQRVSRFVAESPCNLLVFSCEDLSYLRHQDEMARLQALLPECQIQIAMYLREKSSFIKSYQYELKKHKMPQVINPDSFAYTGDDSWLFDLQTRCASFRDWFGKDNVITLDYDQEYRNAGNIIPSFLDILGVKSHFAASDWNAFFINRSPPEPPSNPPTVKRMARIKQRLKLKRLLKRSARR